MVNKGVTSILLHFFGLRTMTSFADYDEFGNYIGADLDSDEDEEMDAQPAYTEQHAQPLEGFDEEEAESAPVNEGALMHIGKCSFLGETTSSSR